MDPTDFTWRSEAGDPAPTRLSPVDDRLKADSAVKRASRGEYLLYTGDFHNAKQLLAAMGRRLGKPRAAKSPAEAFRAERAARQREHELLGRVVVALDEGYRLQLARAPDVAEACTWVWGPPESSTTVVSLRQLLGMLGAAEWRRKGLVVPGLGGRIHPHYGVYVPTRTDYIELLPSVTELKGKRLFDVGTGTGVLSFVLLGRGAASAVGTDLDPRAVACARENAERLGLGKRFEAMQADLFPEGKADLVISNPPWIPEAPRTPMDAAVFDEGSRFLTRFLEGLAEHLEPGGEGLLLLSDLAVRLGLRPASWLDEQLARAGLSVKWKRGTSAKHGKAKDPSDPLHVARAGEEITLYCLVPAAS